MSIFKKSVTFNFSHFIDLVDVHLLGLTVRLERFFRPSEDMPAATAGAPRRQADAPALDHSDALFARALHADSDKEFDWLWAAACVTRASQRRYCLKRALAINPESSLARGAMAKLSV